MLFGATSGFEHSILQNLVLTLNSRILEYDTLSELNHRCPTPPIRKKAPRVTKIDFAPRNLARGLLNSSMEGAARHGGGGCELDGGGCEARIRSPPHPSSSPLHLEGAATPCPTKCDPEIWPMPDIFEP